MISNSKQNRQKTHRKEGRKSILFFKKIGRKFRLCIEQNNDPGTNNS